MRLIIDLLARTGMFETDMKRAEKSLEQFRKKAREVGKVVGLAFAAAGTAVTVMVRNAIRDIDSLALMSTQIGLTTDNLSRMRYAAEQMAGVSAGQFDMALRRMTRRIAEAAEGGGPAANALRAIGLEAQALSKMSPDEQFRKLADAMKATENQGSRLRATMAIFDTEGMPLVNMLRQGSDAIREFEGEADKLGLTIDSKTAAASREFTKQLQTLSAVKQGLVLRITAAVLPTLNALTQQFVGSAKGAESLDKAARVAASGMKIMAALGAIVVGAFKTLGEYLGGVAAAFVALLSGRFRDAFNIAKETTFDVVANVKSAAENVAQVWKGVEIDPGPASDAIAAPVTFAEKKIKDASGRVSDQVQRMLERMKRDVQTFGMESAQVQLFDLQAAGATPQQIEQARAYLDELARLQKAQEELDATTKRAAEAQREIAQVYEQTRTPAEALSAELERLNRLLAAGMDWDTYSRAVFDAQDRFDKAMEAAKGSLDEMDTFAKNAAENIQRNFGDTLFDAMRGNFKGIGDSFVEMMQRMVAEALAADLARAMFGGDEKGGVTGKGGWFGSALGAIGDWFGFAGSRASGGDVLANRAHLVGEREPEWFIPRTAGTIVPMSNLAAAGANARGAGPTYINVGVEGRVDRSTRMQVAQDVGREVRRSQRFA